MSLLSETFKLKVIVPEVGNIVSIISCSNTDFPDATGPINATVLFAGISNDIFFNT